MSREEQAFVLPTDSLSRLNEQRELQKIECLVGGLHSWRGLHRMVSVSQAWHTHLWGRVLSMAQRPWTGAAIGVLRYEASSVGALYGDEKRVVEIFVRREDDRSTAGVLIEHLQAVEVLW